MDEPEALRRLAETVPGAGDDAAVVDGLVVTTDMLHETTDFPDGTTAYTAGWRGKSQRRGCCFRFTTSWSPRRPNHTPRRSRRF